MLDPGFQRAREGDGLFRPSLDTTDRGGAEMEDGGGRVE